MARRSYDREIWGGKNNIVGSKIRKLRIERNMTQETLKAKLELYSIHVGDFSRIETGKRAVTDIEILAIADIFNVPICVLFDDFKLTF